MGDRPGHPVHPAGLAVPQRGLRLPGRQPSPTAATSRSSPPTAPTTPRSSRPRPRPRRRRSTSTCRAGCRPAAVHVWSTDVNAPTAANTFVQQASITPVNGAYSLTVQPGYVYTLTTTTGQGKGTATGPAQSHAAAALLRHLRRRHRRPAAAVPVADAGRVRDRAVRGRPVGRLPPAAGGDRAGRVGRQRQPLHHRREPELGELHGLGRRDDGAGGRGAAARPGRHAWRRSTRPTSTTTTSSSATPARGRSCATRPAAR